MHQHATRPTPSQVELLNTNNRRARLRSTCHLNVLPLIRKDHAGVLFETFVKFRTDPGSAFRMDPGSGVCFKRAALPK
eukprot:201520-Amphidinium_carterae.1